MAKTETEQEPIIDTVRKVIGEELGKLFSSGKAEVTDDDNKEKPRRSTPTSNEPKGIGDLVRDEVARIREGEERDKKFKEHDDAIEHLKRATEKPPSNTRKVTRAFWGSDDE